MCDSLNVNASPLIRAKSALWADLQTTTAPQCAEAHILRLRPLRGAQPGNLWSKARIKSPGRGGTVSRARWPGPGAAADALRRGRSRTVAHGAALWAGSSQLGFVSLSPLRKTSQSAETLISSVQLSHLILSQRGKSQMCLFHPLHQLLSYYYLLRDHVSYFNLCQRDRYYRISLCVGLKLPLCWCEVTPGTLRSNTGVKVFPSAQPQIILHCALLLGNWGHNNISFHLHHLCKYRGPEKYSTYFWEKYN